MNYIIILFFIILGSLFTYHVIVEPIYAFFFRKPIYVHFYPFPSRLTKPQKEILKTEFEFYQTLSPIHKKYFEHRVANFLETYVFLGREDFEITDQVKVLIASTSVMLTFGMRKYLFAEINKVIVFPDIYYSSFTKEYHKGELNINAKAIVFSWKHFLEGYKISNDNLNLGLHEFSHLVHFSGTQNSDTSSAIFVKGFSEILEMLKSPKNQEYFIQSGYFRTYAYTNQFELLAVMLEHFFETPKEFKKKFPELYEKVREMINFAV